MIYSGKAIRIFNWDALDNAIVQVHIVEDQGKQLVIAHDISDGKLYILDEIGDADAEDRSNANGAKASKKTSN